VTESKLTAALPVGWSEAEYRALAMAALNQAGVSPTKQKRIAALIGVCIDCQLADAEHNDRCLECAEIYDEDRMQHAREIARGV
jgi:hypothetical protein